MNVFLIVLLLIVGLLAGAFLVSILFVTIYIDAVEVLFKARSERGSQSES